MSHPLALIAEVTHQLSAALRVLFESAGADFPARRNSQQPTGCAFSARRRRLEFCIFALTGGEPLARPDITELIPERAIRRLYTNLITSGIGLTRERLAGLVDAGLDHIQLSFQDSTEAEANWIAGTRAHAHKLEVAGWIREHGSHSPPIS